MDLVNGVLYIIDSDYLHITDLNKHISSYWPLPAPKRGLSLKVDHQEDRIYFTLVNSHKIHVHNRKGKPLQKFGSKGSYSNQFRGPRGITVDDQYLYICDTQNHRIQVLNKTNGTFIRTFTVRELEWPRGILLCDNLLYISGSRLHVFTKEGRFIQIFGKEELGKPRAIWVINDRLYLADLFYHRIYVYV